MRTLAAAALLLFLVNCTSFVYSRPLDDGGTSDAGHGGSGGGAPGGGGSGGGSGGAAGGGGGGGEVDGGLPDGGPADGGGDPCLKCSAPADTCTGGVLTVRTPTCVAQTCGVATATHTCPQSCGLDTSGAASCVGKSAIGVLDTADDNGLGGWACDPDTSWRPGQIHAYFDGPAGSPKATGIPGIMANRPSEAAVNTLCGGGLFHRFLWTMSEAQAANLPPGVHGAWTYAISNGAGEFNTTLNTAPKWLPVPANAVTAKFTAGLERKAIPKAGGVTGGSYAYGPTIMRYQGEYHLWACNADNVHLGDSIAYVHSADGVNWSAPVTVLDMPSELSTTLLHTCDPSVVKFTPPGSTTPYFYMFYSAHNHPPGGWGTVNAVARSTSLAGPFRHYMGGDPNNDANWVAHPTTAMPVFLQKANVACASSCYGIGEPSVSLKDNTLTMFFNVANDATPSKVGLYRTTSTDGVTWSTPTQTNHPSEQVDVKWDPASKRYVMFAVVNQYSTNAAFQVKTSPDGLTWTNVGTPVPVPDYAAEWGFTGDENGFLVGDTTLLGFAAPYNLTGTKKCVDAECELFVSPLTVTWQ